MKEIIKKISVNPGSLEVALEWMAQYKNNDLSETELTNVVRYLLAKIVELEDEVNKLKSEK